MLLSISLTYSFTRSCCYLLKLLLYYYLCLSPQSDLNSNTIIFVHSRFAIPLRSTFMWYYILLRSYHIFFYISFICFSNIILLFNRRDMNIIFIYLYYFSFIIRFQWNVYVQSFWYALDVVAIGRIFMLVMWKYVYVSRYESVFL